MGFEKFGKFGYVSQTKISQMLSYLEKGQLAGTRCAKCKTLHFPPTADCSRCRGTGFDWVQLDGSCTLVTFTEVYFAPPQFQTDTPYLLGLAELNEGPRVFAPIDKRINRNLLKPGLPMVLRVAKRGEDGWYYQLEEEPS